jgi:arylsulfatase A-like enzyme
LKYGKGYPGLDCISRVPLLVRWPGEIRRPGRIEHEIVEAVDLVPTLLECAGVQTPAFLQGRSLLPLLRDESYTGKGSAIMEHAGWKTIRTECFRYVTKADGGELLFDLANDPGEYRDESQNPAYNAVISELRGMLLRRMLNAERPLKRTWTY